MLMELFLKNGLNFHFELPAQAKYPTLRREEDV